MSRKKPDAPHVHAQAVIPLTDVERKRLAQAAHKEEVGKLIGQIARKNLTPAVHNRKVTEAHLEVILTLIAAGDTLSNVCEALEISSGAVSQRAIDDPDFGRRLAAARELGAGSLFESMMKIAWNDDEPVERSKLKISTLDRIASAYNRMLSVRQQVDVRQAVAYVLPPEANLY